MFSLLPDHFKESITSNGGQDSNQDGKVRTMITNYHLCRDTVIQKARARTIKMTLIIMVAFTIFWSPYAFISLWESLAPDKALAAQVHLPKGLFVIVAANSCVNPFVYRMNLIRRFPQNLHRS